MKSKEICSLLLAASLCLGAASIAEAANQMNNAAVSKVVTMMDGDWYDSDGNLVLQIKDGSINGHPILAGYDFAGGLSHAQGNFALQGNQMIFLSWDLKPNDLESSANTIILNQKTTLHRTKTVSFYESIGGLHLRMSQADVQDICGKPDKYITVDHPYVLPDGTRIQDGWYFEKQRLIAAFNTGSLESITLLRGCPLKFDKSGLGIENKVKEFVDFYHSPETIGEYSTQRLTIGKDEYAWFDYFGDHITFSAYSY